jgi:peptide chain release factor 1
LNFLSIIPSFSLTTYISTNIQSNSIQTYHQYTALSEELEGTTELFQEAGDDPEMREMARSEMKGIESRMEELEEEIQLLLLPKDPNDDRNVMIEVRAGTGGSEANIFAGESIGSFVEM